MLEAILLQTLLKATMTTRPIAVSAAATTVIKQETDTPSTVSTVMVNPENNSKRANKEISKEIRTWIRLFLFNKK